LQQQIALAKHSCVVPAVNLAPCRRAFRPRMAVVNRSAVKNQISWSLVINPRGIKPVEIGRIGGVTLDHRKQDEVEVVHKGSTVSVRKEPDGFASYNRFELRLDPLIDRIIPSRFQF